jgi:hypothetical protein
LEGVMMGSLPVIWVSQLAAVENPEIMIKKWFRV